MAGDSENTHQTGCAESGGDEGIIWRSCDTIVCPSRRLEDSGAALVRICNK